LIPGKDCSSSIATTNEVCYSIDESIVYILLLRGKRDQRKSAEEGGTLVTRHCSHVPSYLVETVLPCDLNCIITQRVDDLWCQIIWYGSIVNHTSTCMRQMMTYSDAVGFKQMLAAKLPVSFIDLLDMLEIRVLMESFEA
jgi:hypothetical protein